jgi:hypothetical protein
MTTTTTNFSHTIIKKILPNGDSEFCITVSKDDTPKDLLQMEQMARDISNHLGSYLTADFIKTFEIKEETLLIGEKKFYSKGTSPQIYETCFGPVYISRSMYQSSEGGKLYCPLEFLGGMVNNATPLFAQTISLKAANLGAPMVVDDLLHSNGRKISVSYVKKTIDSIGVLALAHQESWIYDAPIEIDPLRVATLSLGLDGTCMFLINGGGWREAMVGTISMYDRNGERLHTIYLGAGPEYGKEKFLSMVDAEWKKAIENYPKALTQGLADGAPWIWKWLTERTDIQVLDFFHLSEYIAKAAAALNLKEQEQEDFKTEWCHDIKHHCRAVYKLISELETIVQSKRKNIDRASLRTVIEYLKNQARRTNYLRELRANRPIGSGVTESACKRLIKARMCQAGMRWKLEGAANVIAVRALLLTAGRWVQFWSKIMAAGGYQVLMAQR